MVNNLSLTLFMFGVGTDHHNPPFSTDHTTFVANFFDWCSYFHSSSLHCKLL